uniref:Uncharacterized protein n=1 Tax=Oryza glumipatula TaxID=40148 RepID=A0A0E0ASI8_9ORYZ
MQPNRQAPAVPQGVRQTVATVGILPLYLVGVGVSGEAIQKNPPEFIKRSLCRKISEVGQN